MSKAECSMRFWRNSNQDTYSLSRSRERGAGVSVVALCAISLWLGSAGQAAEPAVLESQFLHLRSSALREWSDYPEMAQGAEREIRFQATENPAEQTLRLRQEGVKQTWRVRLNEQRLGELVVDEKDQLLYLPVPPGVLKTGENVLRIEPLNPKPTTSDDIRVGQISLDVRPRKQVLSEATLEIQVTERAAGAAIPCRITIVNADGALQATGASSSNELALRAGVIYAATGRATIPLPAGKYRVHATRGFEYSLGSIDVAVKANETQQVALALAHEVDTAGYVACDTHIHTLTHSGHGDCSLAERLITLAGEGIELPIATDHNVQIDYRPDVAKQQLEQFLTPVIGNEVTTSLGHFNVFPVAAGAHMPDHTLRSWESIFADFERTPGVKAIILNHARDIHSNVRPFGPKLHIGVAGENTEGWPLRFNAMEVINSGATQTDGAQLIRDWMALLNRGHDVTPVGSSDSHDVSRYIVGQGRTYIRAGDDNPGAIDARAAIDNFVQGKVLVSYGLLADLTVSGKYGPGEFAACPDDEVEVQIRVQGPSWTKADRVQLFANGVLIKEEALPHMNREEQFVGLHWQGTWKIPGPKQDVHLVAAAWGPGVDGPYWQTSRPYQPTSPEWKSYTLGISGAVWLDGDRDGKRSSASDYAERLFAQERGAWRKIVARLADYDEAVAIQAASRYRVDGGDLEGDEFLQTVQEAGPRVQSGLRQYLDGWRENRRAQAIP